MNNTRNVASYLLALSIFSLAGALIYFTVEVTRISRQIPDILVRVEETSKTIEPVVKEVAEMRDLIPRILEQVEETRSAVPPILEEIRKTREQIPPILKEVEAMRKQIPDIIHTTDKASDAITAAAKEVAETRPLIPKILEEVEKTRVAIPLALDEAHEVIAEYGEAGKKASEGAVSGVITGIFTAPFTIVGGVGKSILGLSATEDKDFTEDDVKLFEERGKELLLSGKTGDVLSWESPETGSSRELTLIGIQVKDGRECRTLQLRALLHNKRHLKKDITFCKIDDNKWQVKE